MEIIVQGNKVHDVRVLLSIVSKINSIRFVSNCDLVNVTKLSIR